MLTKKKKKRNRSNINNRGVRAYARTDNVTDHKSKIHPKLDLLTHLDEADNFLDLVELILQLFHDLQGLLSPLFVHLEGEQSCRGRFWGLNNRSTVILIDFDPRAQRSIFEITRW